MMPLLPSKPSISVSSWLRVCSLSSLPPPTPAPRCLPTASISSMKIKQGLFSLARLNRSRTRLAPTPTNISTNSDPESEKKGTPASPAIAFASRVFPVPGGPTSSTPLGIFAPTEVKRSGVFRKVTTSWRSCLASSTPATSSNLTPVSASIAKRALVLPNCIACPGPPGMPLPRRERKISEPISSNGKSKLPSNPSAGGAVLGG